MDMKPSILRAITIISTLLATLGGDCNAATLFNSSNKFLLFPNPQVQDDGSYQTDTTAYAQAYYEAIDPNNDRDTLAKWKAINGIGTVVGGVDEVSVVFGDTRDLGYGRQMTVRHDTATNTVAAMVGNFQVGGYAGNYNHLSLVAAVKNATRKYHVGTNAIEYSPGPLGGAVKFAKFYNFDPKTGRRNLTVNLDGLGAKAMPGACISCHGGRADPLTPPSNKDVLGNPISPARPLFNLVQNSLSQQRGDVQARLQPFKVDTFDFAPEISVGYSRASQEAKLKKINQMVLCTYPIAAATAFPEDACRPVIDGTNAGFSEWEGDAAAFIKAAYGGDGMPNSTFSDIFIPASWTATADETSLYQKVVAPFCMTCHMIRGTGNQSDINFMDAGGLAKFQGHIDRIKAHVFDRGNMPLAKIVNDNFWGTAGVAARLASYIETFLGTPGALHNGAGAVLQPGRPIADPGPDRVITQGPVTLSARGSLYATAFSWTVVSDPGVAPTLSTLKRPKKASSNPNPIFNATMDGTYVLSLVARNGTQQSAPAQLTLVVDSTLPVAPSAIKFSDIKTVLQGPAGCTGCHFSGQAAGGGGVPPLFYDDYDRNGDGVINATDDLWFYKEVRGRINFTDIASSPLLRKPSGHHHNGGLLTGFDISAQPPGHVDRENYDLFVNWIMNGAPYN